MKFSQWRLWVRSKPWSLKWFIILVLLRPIIDNFYYLKEVSPFLSPLNWAGVFTLILCIPPVFRSSYITNRIHRLFNIWSGLIILNTIFLIFQPVDYISMIQWILKLSLPVYLFAFLRVFLRNKTDLTGLLITFLYSAGIAVLILLYELIFQPVRIEYTRGIERIQGGYADVMNYAIYLSFGFLIFSYFYISYKTSHRGLKIKLPFLILIGSLCIAGIFGISHAVSYVVFISLLLLFITSIARKYSSISLVLMFILWISLSFYGDKLYQKRIDPLVEKELEVVRGERDESQFLHGRMSRWQYAWSIFKGSPLTSWILGYPTSLESPFFNISIGIHNDYLRIFYFTGISGIFIYILFLYNLWRRKRFLYLAEKYLLYGSLAILILYSVSTTPTFYANFLYILFSIFAYFSLHPAQLIKNE